MSMKTVELTEPHEHAGKPCQPGDQIELDTADADNLIGMNKAKPAGKTHSRMADPVQSETIKEHTA